MENTIIEKYFTLTDKQKSQFAQLPELYQTWNAAINVISRKDMDNLMERHILHALAIAKVISFPDGSKIMDIGTGGGFPGIPLAILFPNAHFHMVDSIGKKLKVVEAVAEALNLKNVTTEHNRAEKVKDRYHFIVSRAVTSFPQFEKWIRGKFLPDRIHPHFSNGLFYLKGGDLREELKPYKKRVKLISVQKFFPQVWFEGKVVMYYRAGGKN
ncbi:MAG: 16S rRNA (guanine(527)-N(7))-methyltransferase RsmG [Cryomorphaceae bacterium]|nr:16S rRNA (guanine(527)-N(7))-methyltransferase RsmG [Cryomorphaceae bacterium]